MDSVHATIAVSNVAEVVDLDDDYAVVEVTNEETGGNTASLFVTVGSADDDPAVPVTNARGTLQIRPGKTRAIGVIASGATRVRLVCSDLEPYSVTGYSRGEFEGAAR